MCMRIKKSFGTPYFFDKYVFLNSKFCSCSRNQFDSSNFPWIQADTNQKFIIIHNVFFFLNIM